MSDMLFNELVVDVNGDRLEGDPQKAPVEVIAALWDSIHDVFDAMGKPRRTAKSGSGRKASSRKASR